MNPTTHLRLSGTDIGKISSPYLDEGRKQESWRIDHIDIDDQRLSATVSMRSTFASDTDTKGFHLSFITALEFLSQLQIVYMHVWAGLSEKNQEAWVVECHVQARRPVRNPDCMSVDMRATSMRKRAGAYYCIAEHTITDDRGGEFSVRMKMLLS